MPSYTMQELELETAELLPARETLCVPSYGHSSGGHNVSQNGQGNVNGGIAYNQVGLINVQADNDNVNILGLQGVFN
jgi:hypothetical protein